jgi:hypothetical protein
MSTITVAWFAIRLAPADELGLFVGLAVAAYTLRVTSVEVRIPWVARALAAMAVRGRTADMPSQDPDQTTVDSCMAPQYRQFDSFVGDWDTYDVGAPDSVIPRNRVGIILGGCVVHEVYDQTDGSRGESFSIYDAARGRWHQTWVTKRG